MQPVQSASAAQPLHGAFSLPRELYTPLSWSEWQVIGAERPDLDVQTLFPAVTTHLLKAAEGLTTDAFLALPESHQVALLICAQVGRCRLQGQVASRAPQVAVLLSTLAPFEEALTEYLHHLQQHDWHHVTMGRHRQTERMLKATAMRTARRLVLMGIGYLGLTRESLFMGMQELHSRTDRWALTLIAKSFRHVGHPGFSQPVATTADERIAGAWVSVETTPLKSKAMEFVEVVRRSTKEAQTTTNNNGTFTLAKRRPWQAVRAAFVLATVVCWCHENGVATWEDALQNRAFTRYLEARRLGTWMPKMGRPVLQYSTLRDTKDILLSWLRWVSCSHQADLDPTVHVPLSVTKRVKKYTRPPSRGLVIVLLHQLITNHSGLIDDTRHRDFYLRRACMLLALTGLRAHEVMLLDWNCLRSANSQGAPFCNRAEDGTLDEYWILQVNKTKTNPLGAEIRVGREVAELILELQNATPKMLQIFCAADTGQWGDGRTAFRLFPADPNQKSFFFYHTLRDWMVKLQLLAARTHEELGTDLARHRWLTPHDLRRIRVSTLKMLRVPERDIARALNHKSIQTQQEYLSNRDWIARFFRDIATASPIAAMIVDDADPYESASDALLSEAGKQAAPTASVSLLVDAVLQHLAAHPELQDLPSRAAAKSAQAAAVPLAPLRGGLPLHLWNCTAPAFVRCRNNDLACGGCDHYEPDPEKHSEHEVYLFRVYVYTHFCRSAEKELPAPLRTQKLVKLKLEGSLNEPGLVDDAEAMLRHTFGAKYGYSLEQITELRSRLQARALAYWRKYGKTRPNPTNEEAAAFLANGTLQ